MVFLFFTGLDYLTQAIKSWETALDSIENAAYMQSQVRALPVCKLIDIRTPYDKFSLL